MGLSLWRAHNHRTPFVTRESNPNNLGSGGPFGQEASLTPHICPESVAYGAPVEETHHSIRQLACVSRSEMVSPMQL